MKFSMFEGEEKLTGHTAGHNTQKGASSWSSIWHKIHHSHHKCTRSLPTPSESTFAARVWLSPLHSSGSIPIAGCIYIQKHQARVQLYRKLSYYTIRCFGQ